MSVSYLDVPFGTVCQVEGTFTVLTLDEYCLLFGCGLFLLNTYLSLECMLGSKYTQMNFFFMQVDCVWSLMHVQVTVLYLEETKPQQNDIHFVSNLNTVKVYSTWHTMLNRTVRENTDTTIE
jgi:hypothetical protein